MKTKQLSSALLVLSFMLTLAIPFQSCEPKDEDSDGCDSCSIAYKPNIYIYPEEEMDLKVQLSFPLGGHVLTSIPEYGDGWQVKVDTLGIINSLYSYLFYESTQPDVWQRQEGWLVERSSLTVFFKQNMADYGFNVRETNDFIDYWIPRLKEAPFYAIYPQTSQLIDQVIQLNVSKTPTQILRIFYVINEAYDKEMKLKTPTIVPFSREGFTLTEWGVIIDS